MYTVLSRIIISLLVVVFIYKSSLGLNLTAFYISFFVYNTRILSVCVPAESGIDPGGLDWLARPLSPVQRTKPLPLLSRVSRISSQAQPRQHQQLLHTTHHHTPQQHRQHQPHPVLGRGCVSVRVCVVYLRRGCSATGGFVGGEESVSSRRPQFHAQSSPGPLPPGTTANLTNNYNSNNS